METTTHQTDDRSEFDRHAAEMLRTVGERFTGADVPAALVEHFRSTVVAARRVESHRADPMFALGSEETYDVRFSDGSRFLLTLWGNEDGWGIIQKRVPEHVPAVADVIRCVAVFGCSQDEAVRWLGGTP